MPMTDYRECLDAELIVIPCGRRKLERRARVADMYTGSYHRACRSAAEALRPGRLVVLSAGYGLLDLEEVIEPYDTPIGSADSVGASLLMEQAVRRHLVDLDPVVVLGGRRHVALATAVWPHALTPLAGTRGIGQQFARLSALARTAALPDR